MYQVFEWLEYRTCTICPKLNLLIWLKFRNQWLVLVLNIYTTEQIKPTSKAIIVEGIIIESNTVYFLNVFCDMFTVLNHCYLFLGFTRPFAVNLSGGQPKMIMLYWSEQISQNCTYLLPNYFPLMTVYRFVVDPQ